MTQPVPYTDAAPFPAPSWPDHTGGELVQSVTYRQSYAPAHPGNHGYDPPDRHGLIADAPSLLRCAAGGAWALVSATAAGCVLVVLVLVLVRVVGWLT
jgi:hypothetical protein